MGVKGCGRRRDQKDAQSQGASESNSYLLCHVNAVRPMTGSRATASVRNLTTLSMVGVYSQTPSVMKRAWMTMAVS